MFYYRLIFATRFARLQGFLRRKEYADAASDLVAIVREDMAPASWWAVVLYDSIPLLDYGQFRGFLVLCDGRLT